MVVLTQYKSTDFLYPLDLFNELLSSVDKAISANKHLIEDPDKGLRFRITRSVGAPVTLKVKSERKMLKKRGCVKKVIMLIQYLRDIQTWTGPGK